MNWIPPKTVKVKKHIVMIANNWSRFCVCVCVFYLSTCAKLSQAVLKNHFYFPRKKNTLLNRPPLSLYQWNLSPPAERTSDLYYWRHHHECVKPTSAPAFTTSWEGLFNLHPRSGNGPHRPESAHSLTGRPWFVRMVSLTSSVLTLHQSPSGLRTQSPPVFPVNAWLCRHDQFQPLILSSQTTPPSSGSCPKTMGPPAEGRSASWQHRARKSNHHSTYAIQKGWSST